LGPTLIFAVIEPTSPIGSRFVIAAWSSARAKRPLLTRRDTAPTHRAGEPVAQMVEHLTFNQVVLGSSPSGLTKQKQSLALV
jgi:hypothetical protein